MKAAFILLFFVLAWQGPSPYQSSQNNVKAQAEDDQGQTKNGTPIAGRASPNKDAHTTSKQTEQSKEQSIKIVSTPKILTESQKDSWDRALVISTCTLVLIGLLQIVLLWRTVNATNDNAEAALTNASTLINSERPWLLLGKRMIPDRSHSANEFEFRIHNFGRTPAKVTAIQIDLRFGESGTAPPFPEFFDKIESFNSCILPQNEELTYAMSATDAKGVSEAANHLWLSGLVRYQDTFESHTAVVQETLFCFRLMHRGWGTVWQRGPDKYNKAT